jgi:plastocyanin
MTTAFNKELRMRAWPLLVCIGVVAALAFAGQAGAANHTVWAGPGFLKAAPAGVPETADANLFFPRRLEVRVGDTVTFKSDGFHTATYLGTHKATEFPIFVPAADKSTYSGIADVAGSPFYFNGLPKFTYNVEQVFAPTGSNVISGGADVHSSGILDKKGYTYRFTKVGDYAFRCLVHPMMTVHVVVKPRAARVQSASQLLKATAAELASAVATAKKLDKVAPEAPNTVYAGVGKQVPGGSIELMAFKPQKLRVKVGTTVTFQLDSPMEIHNMVFGPADYLEQSFKTLDLAPQGPGQPNQVWPFFFYGTDPAQAGVYTYSGTNHGNGFLATPLMGPEGTPLPKTFKITFTAPGVFKYICGIHGEDMNGEIEVVS